MIFILEVAGCQWTGRLQDRRWVQIRNLQLSHGKVHYAPLPPVQEGLIRAEVELEVLR